MAIRVEANLPDVSAMQIMARIRQAEIAAAGPVLAEAAAGAPIEDEPRHGVHMRDTGYVRFVGTFGGADRVAVGFSAFWSRWQHERMGWHHTHGHAKFLELAVVHGAGAWRARLAEEIRNRLVP